MQKNIIGLFLLIMLPCMSQAQAVVNWGWQNITSTKHKDIEYQNGFLYAVGNTSNGIFISKTDTTGNIIWTNNYVGSAVLENCTLDNSGSIYAIGSFSGNMNIGANNLSAIGGTDILIIKCDANGSVLMTKKAGGNGNENGVDIALDNTNNIYALANNNAPFSFANTTCSADGFINLLKYNSLGNEIWLNWLHGQNNAGFTPSQTYYSTSLKYSSFDSSLVLSGSFGSGYIDYGVGGGFNGINNPGIGTDAFIFKVNKNGSFLGNWPFGSYDNAITISDLAINNAGDIFFGVRNGFSLNGYLYNDIMKLPYGGSEISIGGLSSNSNFFNNCANYGDGTTGKLFLNNSMLYGLIYQPDLISCGNNCSDYYALQINTNTNSQTYVSLDPNNSYFGIAGINGNYYVGSQNGISKSCNTCPINFSLNPAPDKVYCSTPVTIGNPECYYVKGGTPVYTYSWSPSTGLNATNILQPQVSGITTPITYTLTVTDQLSNVIYDTIHVSIGTSNTSTITAGICTANLPYVWNNMSYYNAGTYSQIFQNASGCDSTVTLILGVYNSPVNQFYDTVCASTLPYLWNGQSITQGGNYTHNVYNPPGCDSVYYLSLNVITEQGSNPFYVYQPPSIASVCANNLPFVWNGQNINTAGMHTFNYTSMYTGCTLIDTLFLTVNPNPITNNNTSVCSNQLPFTWNNLSLTTSGTFNTYFTSASGCDSASILNLTVQPIPQPVIVQFGNQLICNGVSNVNYLWTLNNNVVGSNNDTISITQNGAYIVMCTDSLGCVGFDTIQVISVGIPSNNLFDGISLYPNPAHDLLNIEFDLNLASKLNVRILDLAGKSIANLQSNQMTKSGHHIITISLKDLHLAQGVYVLQLSSENQKWNQRFVYRK